MQPKDKNDSVQFPTRYQQYDFSKRHLGGGSGRKVFPIGANDKETIELQGQPHTNTLTARYEGAQATGSYIVEGELDAQEIRQLNQPKHSNDRIYGTDGVSPTLNTMQGGNRQPFIAPVLTPDRLKKRQNGRRFKENGEPSFTLTAQDKHGVRIDSRIRRLTPTECARLQGFPDDWCADLSDTQQYKCYGNAVTVNVIEAIMSSLL